MRMGLLIILLVTCSGCVVWYKDFPRPAVTAEQQGVIETVLPADPGFEQCVVQIIFPTYPKDTVQGPRWDFVNMPVPVQGGKVVFIDHRHETGVMPEEERICEARITFPEREWEWKRESLLAANVIASAGTFFLFPLLGLPDMFEYSVKLFVLNPQDLTREYRYRFRKAGVFGISVLPFLWINWFTSTEQEAFQAIFRQFLFDLQRDRAAMLPERPSPTR